MDALARLVFGGALALASLVSGCQSQAEGERCNLNSDCVSPLICMSLVCCPQTGASTAPACNPGVSTDAGGVTTDAGAEAAEEAAADTGGGATEDAADAGAE